MPRPGKEKRICRLPVYQNFEAKDLACKDDRQLLLGVDEFETIRLIDYLGMTQEECAAQMQVGRATVQSIYADARKKIARFLVEGARLKISGGTYRLCREVSCRCQIQKKISKSGGRRIMKIAVTYENGSVFQHFGHTEQFKVYEVEDGKVVNSKVVDTNGSGHGALGGFLADLGVEVLICGGIGGGARNALAECGITLYPGAQGLADGQVAAFLAGTLNYDPDTVCKDHAHAEGEGCHDHSSESCGHGCH
ncbi:nitrogenase cofactor biosynthesis protein NifB [uncultured Roseburia sp.]|uniref:DUF134 domain-containing protein n=1 Tax=Brotonthovivens ammoniilytica TaxID=2981725 RepID=A0ABT2TM98_9FIRM|nr:NifB/NifX family molybdenum-iron cluster-binding protein [Brotonthovivens ammoniilytica]MCU6762911.1 DUF134 domain-containing protein [Brotonthovivens ammoniilytica]SCI93577.1 nitrogenase cofactor biosynthesis protein NifB [uncultured Roseburia sp.]